MSVCVRCRGAKEVRGMGGIVRKCPECLGAGVIEVVIGADDVVSAAVEQELIATSATTKKPASVKGKKVKDAGIKPSAVTIDAAPVAEVAPIGEPKKPIEIELGEMAGYTPLMVEAIMAEPRMKPDEWRNKYAAVISNPLSLPDGSRQCLPDLQSRARFRESVGRAQKPKPRKHDTMKTHDLAGKLEGIE